MKMTGEQHIRLSQPDVWKALNNPAILQACIPGCESIESTADNEYRVVMTAAIGPVKAKFDGKLALSDINPPHSYSLAFQGSGGAVGFGKGGAHVSLAPEEEGSLLSYEAHAQVGGKLAQVGSRLIDGVAKKMAEDFFTRFKAAVEPAAVAPAAGPAAAPPPRGAMWSRALWMFLIALFVVAVIFFAA